MGWKQLADFDGSIRGITMTVRVTKSDDSIKPKYSIAIGNRNDPQPFRPFMRGDMLNMEEIDEATQTRKTGLSVLIELEQKARDFMKKDHDEHIAKLERDEAARRAALAGKRGGDAKANTGLNAVGKTAKKREKEARRNTA